MILILFCSLYVISMSYYIVDRKRQNRLKVGRDKPKLKVKMQCSQYQMMIL